MNFDLVKGTCLALLDDVTLPSKYVQVLKVEQVAVGGLKVDPVQYRVTISDGMQCIPVMLGMNLNNMVKELELAPLVVVSLEDYLWVNVCTLRIVILTELNVVARPTQIVGSQLELLNVSTDPASVLDSVAKYLEVNDALDVVCGEELSSDTCELSTGSLTDESTRDVEEGEGIMDTEVREATRISEKAVAESDAS
ncbi:hypothetical protein CALCODRAFT_484814 [Calocera cornea HHB12733]|uniref:Replication factor-A protein 1 N-terminal domain-containing protein n=1 Tax=Calocera cornea HHB12733 TaxID=1353952 RepID=A0A165ESI0_9BASI|nr:hypothetical protein CALCODRAFT_484814 [Calocera cornea HHB12733]